MNKPESKPIGIRLFSPPNPRSNFLNGLKLKAHYLNMVQPFSSHELVYSDIKGEVYFVADKTGKLLERKATRPRVREAPEVEEEWNHWN